MATIINASTSNGLIQTADTSGTLQLQSAGTTKFTVDSTGAYGQLQSATAQASTSGTSINFTSIPSWVKRITVMFDGVSTNGTSNLQVQIGAGSVTSSGYNSGAIQLSSSGQGAVSTTGFLFTGSNSAASSHYGSIVLVLISGNTWESSGNLWNTASVINLSSGGSIALGGTLDRVRITTVNGTDTFDAGSINILYE
jgi:hypothetical protein